MLRFWEICESNCTNIKFWSVQKVETLLPGDFSHAGVWMLKFPQGLIPRVGLLGGGAYWQALKGREAGVPSQGTSPVTWVLGSSWERVIIQTWVWAPLPASWLAISSVCTCSAICMDGSLTRGKVWFMLLRLSSPNYEMNLSVS